MNARTQWIVHLDLDAFFCAVEEQYQPRLSGKAFAVGGRPESRGVVASCSYAARQFGVRSAMPMARALRLCPELEVVPSRHGVYGRASRQVMAILRDASPLVEQISIDEAFLALDESAATIEGAARNLQNEVRTQLGLPCSLGAAANKLVAKIANEVGKAANARPEPPNALTIVPQGQEAAFLAPLPVEMLWGVGPKTAERLAELKIFTIGELARRPPAELARRFGKHGEEMALRARGVDERPLVEVREAKSFSQETTFARDERVEVELRRALQGQADKVAQRLQQERQVARTVKLKIRWPDFTTLTRQTTLPQPVETGAEILAAAEQLFAGVWRPGQAVRLIGVGVSGLEAPVRQLSLWDWTPAAPEDERAARLRAALADLRQRYGEGAVVRGLHSPGAVDVDE